MTLANVARIARSAFACASRFAGLRLSAAPDGGPIGAGIAAATFTVYFLVIGLESVWGLIAADMLADGDLGASFAMLALAQGGAMFMELALGMFVSHLCDRVGVRLVVAAGGIALGVGLWAAAATPAGVPELLLVSYAGIAGTGMALAYGAASIGIAGAFTTNAAPANAVAGLGIGFGTLALALVIDALLAGGWRHSMRVLAALELFGCLAAAAAFVPIDVPVDVPVNGERGSDEAASSSTSSSDRAAVGAAATSVAVDAIPTSVAALAAPSGSASPPKTVLNLLRHDHPRGLKDDARGSVAGSLRGSVQDSRPGPSAAHAAPTDTDAAGTHGRRSSRGSKAELQRDAAPPLVPGESQLALLDAEGGSGAASGSGSGSASGGGITPMASNRTPQSPFVLGDGHSASAGAIMPSLSLRRGVLAARVGSTPVLRPASPAVRPSTPALRPLTPLARPSSLSSLAPLPPRSRFAQAAPAQQVLGDARSNLRVARPAPRDGGADASPSPFELPSKGTPQQSPTLSFAVGIDEGSLAGAHNSAGPGDDAAPSSSTVAVAGGAPVHDASSAWPEPELPPPPPPPLPACLAAAARLLSRRAEGAAGEEAAVEAATSLWREPRFLLIAACFALTVSTLSVSESLLGMALLESGHDMDFAATCYSVMGAVGILARVVVGVLTLFYTIDVTALVQVSTVTCGLAIMGLAAHSDSATYCLVYSGVIGGLGGFCYSMATPLLLEAFGFARLAAAIGATLTFRAPAVLVAAPLAGLLRSATGSFAPVWTVTGMCCTLAALPLGMLSFKCERRRGPQAAVRLH